MAHERVDPITLKDAVFSPLKKLDKVIKSEAKMKQNFQLLSPTGRLLLSEKESKNQSRLGVIHQSTRNEKINYFHLNYIYTGPD